MPETGAAPAAPAQTDFVLPSDTESFLRESEAEAVERVPGEEEPDVVEDLAAKIADNAAPQKPTKVQNKGAPPPTPLAKGPKQPPPADRKVPLPDWARTIDANGNRVNVDTLEQLVSMARRGYALQQRAPEISALQQQLLAQKQLLDEHPEQFLSQRDKAWRKQWAETELLEDALEDLILKSPNPQERVAAKEKLLELRQMKETQLKQQQQQVAQRQQLQQMSNEEAARIDSMYSDAIEKHGYPKNRLALKVMATMHQQILSDPNRSEPDARTLAAESIAQIWELMGEHLDSYSKAGDILDGIPQRYHEAIRKAFLSRAKAPQKTTMAPAKVATAKKPVTRDWAKSDAKDKDDFEAEINFYKRKAMEEAGYTGFPR